MNAFVVRDDQKQQHLFTVRHKAKSQSWSAYHTELKAQLARATEYVETGVMVPNQPIDDLQMPKKSRKQ